MSRAIHPLLGAVALILAFSACEEKKTAAQANAEKEKAWHVQQKAKAAKYYQELLDKYPDSEHAAEAKQRLEALGPIATPKGATPKPAGGAKPASPAKK